MSKIISYLPILCSISFSSFAAQSLPSNSTEVTLPALNGGFVLGVQGYYLKPVISNGFNNPILNSQSVSSFDWGWGANIGYVFPQTSNDINLSYFHYSSDDNQSISGSDLTPSAFPITLSGGISPFDILASAFLVTGAHSREEHDLNQVDLAAGQTINVGCGLIFHPIIGLRYADVEHKLNSNYQVIGALEVELPLPGQFNIFFPVSFATQEKSSYQGIGPMVGTDASYYLGNGFGLIGHFTSALLIGDIDSKLNAAISWTSFSTPLIGENIFINGLNFNNSFNNSTRRIVPNVDAKLGLDYTYLFNNDNDTALTLEIGYMASEYFNAIDGIKSSGNAAVNITPIDPAPTSTLSITSVNHRTADFAIHGPYANLTLHF